VDVDEHTGVEDNLSQTCTVCGATLTPAEIETSRESESATFLCSVHASEEVPLGDDPVLED
jgi:recombinational DNA repair protein (RecF pathway)